MDTKQHALAAEIRAEAAAQRISAKDMQRAAGVSSSAWNNYFVKCTRDVPMSVVVAVAAALGMPASELLRRAEERAAHQHPADPEAIAESALGQLSPELRDRVRLIGEDLRPRFDGPESRPAANGE